MKNHSKYIKPFKEILTEFDFTFEVISKKTQQLNDQIKKGKKISSPGYFYEKNTAYEKAINIKKELEIELNRKFVLELTASFEAKTVFYFKEVCKRRSIMYASYRNNTPIGVRNGIKHLMYQHILLIFKETIHPIDNTIYSQFKNLIDYRNWLAHGRGWDMPDHLEKFDVQYSWQIISSLFDLIPDYPENLKN